MTTAPQPQSASVEPPTENVPSSAAPSPVAGSGDPATPQVPLLRVAGVLALRPILILALGLGLMMANLSLAYANALVVLVDVVALAVVGAALHAEGRTLRSLFGRWRWLDLAWGALLLVIVTVGFFAATYIGNLIVYRGPPPIAESTFAVPLWVGIIAVTVMPLSIAVAEEAVYRGYAQPRLQRMIGRLGALVVVAVVFGVQHAGFALTSSPELAARVITTALAGLMFGGLWLWMRRLMPLIVAHWALDLFFLGLPMLALALR